MLPKISLTRGSLTDGNEAVLVNASNTNATLGTGVSAAIARACGERFQEQISRELNGKFGGAMKPGQVLITAAGTHPRAKYVAHVAVMDYRKGFSGESFPTKYTIRTGYEALWDAVESIPGEGPLTVALVALGGGTGSLGVREPIKIACETLKAHCAVVKTTRLTGVTFYGFLDHEYLAIAEVLVSQFAKVATNLPHDVTSYLARAKP
jgi:O-acetyl-ADP-ribose deacetylase (regulator of RNase III)